jgi:hypothetical protein
MQRTPIFTDFEPRHAELFGEHTLHLGHSLHQSPLFTDEALARLIERAPRTHYHANTMDPTTHDPRTRREGEIVATNGMDVLEAVKRGRIWLMLQHPDDLSPEYAELLRDLFAELEARVPGVKTFRQQMTILVSSPGVQVYYHADAPGQMLWQIRGTKRVYLYPAKPPFLPQDRLETIVLGDAHEISLDYHPWFEEYADVVTLEPGRMLHWSLNRPHRIVNEDVLNVSLTTEHFTKRLRSHYLVNYANGLVHIVRPSARLSQSIEGPSAWAKFGLAAFFKLTGLKKAQKRGFTVDFAVDSNGRYGVRDVPARQVWK